MARATRAMATVTKSAMEMKVRAMATAMMATATKRAKLENMLKMQEERAGETRARAVSCGQVRHRLFLVKR